MICARHGAIARTADDHGWPLCYACFGEARAIADARELRAKIDRMRYSSVDSLMRRLAGR